MPLSALQDDKVQERWPSRLSSIYTSKILSMVSAPPSPLASSLPKYISTHMAMSKFKKSQILTLLVLAALLLVTPLLPSSLRPKYLYFLINLLVIALGAEAGLLPGFSNPPEDKSFKPQLPAAEASYLEAQVAPATRETQARMVEKSASQKISTTVKVDRVNKCPSMPSLFFIGGDSEREDASEAQEEEEEEVVGDLSGQELFAKAEIFIGNFYKQLKMQREESWKRIHGFYHKAF